MNKFLITVLLLASFAFLVACSDKSMAGKASTPPLSLNSSNNTGCGWNSCLSPCSTGYNCVNISASGCGGSCILNQSNQTIPGCGSKSACQVSCGPGQTCTNISLGTGCGGFCMNTSGCGPSGCSLTCPVGFTCSNTVLFTCGGVCVAQNASNASGCGTRSDCQLKCGTGSVCMNVTSSGCGGKCMLTSNTTLSGCGYSKKCNNCPPSYACTGTLSQKNSCKGLCSRTDQG